MCKGRVLWKYPRVLVDALYPAGARQTVVDSVVQYCSRYGDLRFCLPDLSETIWKALSPSVGCAAISVKDVAALRSMAYELSGAAHEFCKANKAWPAEDVMLRTIGLCHLRGHPGAWAPWTLEGLAGYAALGRDRTVCHVLRAATLDYIMAYDWPYLPSAVVAHTGVSVAVGGQAHARYAVEAKIAAEGSWGPLEENWTFWRSHVREDLQLGWGNLGSITSASDAFSDATFEVIWQTWEEVFEGIGRLLAGHSATPGSQGAGHA